MRIYRLFFLLLFLFLSYRPLLAEEKNDFAFQRFNFSFENDIFDRTDKGYTNGTKFALIYKVNTEVHPFFKIPFLYDSSKNHFTKFSLGQDIMTPDDTNRTNPDPNDVPYSAWLYLGMAWSQADSKNSDTFEVQLGMVGPAALGEQTQNLVHKLTDSTIANGWDYQLANEPGIIISYEHRWRHVSDTFGGGFSAEAIPFAGAGLGNVLTYADAGGVVRFGWNLPHDFGKSVTHPAQLAGLPAFDKGRRPYKPKFAFYILTVVDVGFIPRNIFLDGNTFKESRSVPERDYVVGELTAGLGIDIYAMHIAFMNTHKTKDFALDERGFDFGTILISYVY